MFERFTEDARNIVVLAQREARALNHNYIGSEALLLGLVLDRGIVGQALAEQEITYESVTAKIVELVGRGNVAPEGHSPFTPRARAILQAANEVSHRSGHGYIGPEHLVFGLLEAEHSVACRVLTALGAKPSAIRRLVGAHFARSYTGGAIFQGFTAAAEGGPYDTHPLRETAEEAAADATGDQEVREIRFGLERSEYFIAVNGGGLPVTEAGRHLDYNRARNAAAAAGARVCIVAPLVKAVTAETASGIEVTLAETIVWEPVRLESRITVLA
jgi:ATP-dependent Clp protease ATP-binding subunit ClpC